mmetsp:Transcript_10363/g.1555  ORF Transcript_10363/g.1555 Transcript_10363/m.1555 type:complete len:84 (+) Transcript_10363:38-289(+)
MVLPQGNYLTYPRISNYRIQSQGEGNRNITETATNMPDPFKTSYLEKTISQFSYTVSGCILPNFDPKGEVEKHCQDNYFILEL